MNKNFLQDYHNIYGPSILKNAYNSIGIYYENDAYYICGKPYLNFIEYI